MWNLTDYLQSTVAASFGLTRVTLVVDEPTALVTADGEHVPVADDISLRDWLRDESAAAGEGASLRVDVHQVQQLVPSAPADHDLAAALCGTSQVVVYESPGDVFDTRVEYMLRREGEVVLGSAAPSEIRRLTSDADDVVCAVPAKVARNHR